MNSTNHKIFFPFPKVIIACLSKYPDISQPEILSVDYINREYNKENNTISIERLFTINWFWFKNVYFIENIFINKSEMTMSNTNITFKNKIFIQENNNYNKHDNYTLLTQNAVIKGFGGFFSKKIEESYLDGTKNGMHLLYKKLGINQILID